MSRKTRNSGGKPHRALGWILFGAACLFFAGCTTVPVYEQDYLSKPNMRFEDAIVYDTEPRFQGSYEPGSPAASGASATGCAACQ
ncbi:MAG: hypothetical protein GVY10_04530 [Verrucomicrobia bacterium]|jgi:hypothetical protein|nr:hypothetical protein [Verrucomicrobiota bacterium]